MSSFDVFYATMPRRVGRAAASKAWDKAVKSGAAPEDIIEGARLYALDCERRHVDVNFMAHPTTWLNQGRWADEYPEPQVIPEPVWLDQRWDKDPNRDYPTMMQAFPHIKKVKSDHWCIYCRATRAEVFDKVLEEGEL